MVNVLSVVAESISQSSLSSMLEVGAGVGGLLFFVTAGLVFVATSMADLVQGHQLRMVKARVPVVGFGPAVDGFFNSPVDPNLAAFTANPGSCLTVIRRTRRDDAIIEANMADFGVDLMEPASLDFATMQTVAARRVKR